MQQRAEVSKKPNLSAAIEKLIQTFASFWSSELVVIRRLRAMADLDPEISQGIAARDARRGQIAREMLNRKQIAGGKTLSQKEQNLVADVLAMLTSFETYDTLAGAGHEQTTVVSTITLLAQLLMNELPKRSA